MLSDNRSRRLQSLFMRGAAALLLSLMAAAPVMLAASHAGAHRLAGDVPQRAPGSLYLLGGSFIVESYFAVPGIGWTVLNAVSSHDLPVMQAILSLTVVIFVVIFILVDLGYALIDPRVDVS
ncbi:ABC transporter permease subunit [Rhizobium ruizarguesonis]|nr:ABC transporter permease subunit [Rhizobium ruizarguesonis]TAZ97008.1 ABC transporter permease subunit [Rhizobium ruizarguesonis]TBA39887.1 ABC transporter permease subunit [Rhizobium ruizarguesonis]TBA82622.1 ABC transporter permease subunit [Rhizobium ruizarguesonis]TBA87579.1 ABC transporter permease subunit [Rhizobium ruizarguesonis]